MRKIRSMPSSTLMTVALELSKLRWSEDAIRTTLSEMVLASGDFPTSSAVEDVVLAVRHEPVYSYKCLWCGQVYAQKEDAALCCTDVAEGWECRICGELHGEASEARECCRNRGMNAAAGT